MPVSFEGLECCTNNSFSSFSRSGMKSLDGNTATRKKRSFLLGVGGVLVASGRSRELGGDSNIKLLSFIVDVQLLSIGVYRCLFGYK